MSVNVALANLCLNTIKSNNKVLTVFKESKEVRKATLEMQVALSEFMFKAFSQELDNDVELTPEELVLLNRGVDGKVPLIKAIRERKQLSLSDAKTYVEDLMVKRGICRTEGGKWVYLGQWAYQNNRPTY